MNPSTPRKQTEYIERTQETPKKKRKIDIAHESLSDISANLFGSFNATLNNTYPITDDETCSICFEDVKSCPSSETTMCGTDCSHRFHIGCLNQWKERANTCPCCRSQI